MDISKRLIASIILLIIAAVAYFFGINSGILWLRDWSPEVGGAAIVLIGYNIINWIMGE